MNDELKNELLEIEDCYTEDTRHFIRFLNAKGLDLDYEGLSSYVESLKSAGYKASTINKRLQGAKNRLRIIFKKSQDSMDILSRYQMDTVLKEIKGMKKNTKAVDIEKTLTMEEVRELLESEAVNDRVKLIIKFLVSTGVRVSEMTGIRLKDMKTEHGYISVRIIGKGTKERFLKVKPKLIQEIKAFFNGAVYLFETHAGARYKRQYISDCIRLAGGAVLNRTIGAHTLRHTFATIQIQKNRKIKALSVYLGHSTTSITQDMYVHEELGLDDLDFGF